MKLPLPKTWWQWLLLVAVVAALAYAGLLDQVMQLFGEDAP